MDKEAMLKKYIKNIGKFIRPQEILSIIYIQLVLFYLSQFSRIQFVAAIISVIQAFKIGIDINDQAIVAEIVVTLGIITVMWIVIKVLILLVIKSSERQHKAINIVKIVACIAVQIDLVTSKQFIQDIVNLVHENTIYADYLEPYQDTERVSLTDKHNLIVIYLESLENTGQLKKYGGYIPDNEENLLENLTAIANNEYASLKDKNIQTIHISQSDKAMIGQQSSDTFGTTLWSMMGSQTGMRPVDYGTSNLFVDGNKSKEQSKNNKYQGIYGLGDILDKDGYSQEFICGSRLQFAGRGEFYQEHQIEPLGIEEILEKYPEFENNKTNLNGFMQIQDKDMYKALKQEITNKYKSGSKFSIAALTIDTHFPGEGRCSECLDEYDDYRDILKCADRQIGEFIDWASDQPWMEDTTIVLMGDHLHMENSVELYNNAAADSNYTRTIYNAIINPVETQGLNEEENKSDRLNNRQFNQADWMPTILAQIGYSNIERINIGTNMFSNRQTLSEELGFDKLDKELQRYRVKSFEDRKHPEG